jgi:hypothetical protein
MSKTENDAMQFANGLVQGDADIFLGMWRDGKFDMIRGHFPTFMGGTEAAGEDDNSHSELDVDPLTDPAYAGTVGNDDGTLSPAETNADAIPPDTFIDPELQNNGPLPANYAEGDDNEN